MNIGERILELRQKQGITQDHLANKAGMMRCYLSRVENGHTVPTVENVERISEALGMKIWDFFYQGPGKLVEIKLTMDESKPTRRKKQ